MSQEEQDLLLGRTTRQVAELSKEIAALRIKASGYAGFYRQAWDAVKGAASEVGTTGDTEIARLAIQSLPNPADVLSTIAEIAQKLQELSQLSAQLKAMRG
jgi:hypothetical protein